MNYLLITGDGQILMVSRERAVAELRARLSDPYCSLMCATDPGSDEAYKQSRREIMAIKEEAGYVGANEAQCLADLDAAAAAAGGAQ